MCLFTRQYRLYVTLRDIKMLTHKLYCVLVSVSLAFIATPCIANSNEQQIAAVSQEIQSLQEKLSAANNKIEQLCHCTITKNMPMKEIPRTANGRH